jgi:ATP-binding cassette, subfamily B, multidrug efflux pump
MQSCKEDFWNSPVLDTFVKLVLMNKGFREKIKRLLEHFRRHKSHIIWGIIVTVLSNTIGMVSPWIVKVAIDNLKENRATIADLQSYAILIIVLALAAGFFRFWMRRTIIWSSREFEYEVRNEFFAHLLKLPRSFYQETPTGDIIAHGSNDVEAVRLLAGPAVMQILNSFVSMSVALTLMFILSWKLSLIALAAFPVLSIMIHRIGMQIHHKFYKIQEHFSRMTSYVQENVSGAKVVKAYNQEKNQTADFEELNKKYIELNLSLAKTRGLFLPLIFALVGLVILFLIYFGGRQVISGSISLGTLVAFIFYLMNLIWPMLAVGWVVSLYQRGTASLERIEKIMNRESEVADSANMSDAKQARGEIEIKNLSFTYPNDAKPILKDINLKISAGKTAAIVGPTGCGKTTLVNLLLRTFKIPDGSIFLDNTDINKIKLAELRKNIGYVPQETFLFSDSLHENIAYGGDNYNEKEITTAAITAEIKDEIEEFPQGFKTVIGERGVTLSGGQKQRAALARAIIGKPPVLILDDAFSSVDTNTEEIILNRLDDVLTSRTSIIISHRISTIKNADLICVMESGQITETGTHDELLKKSKIYARIVELQSIQEELEVIR